MSLFKAAWLCWIVGLGVIIWLVVRAIKKYGEWR